MFTSILVCVDPYPPGDSLLAWVHALKSCGAREVILAHIVEGIAPQAMEGMIVAQARPEMERQQKLLEEAGLAVTLAMPRGVPAQALHELAEGHDVSVIVIGTHGRGLTQTLALGSVSAKLLQLTRRPVLLSRATLLEMGGPEMGGPKEDRNLFAHILFPTDFSDTAEVAFAYLDTLVRTVDCQVTLLHVQDGERRGPHLGHRLPALQDLDTIRLQRMRLWLERSGRVVAGVACVHGTPGDEITKMAKAKGCTLILMGSQGKGVTREILLGSVAHQVVRHAKQPLLLIPALR